MKILRLLTLAIMAVCFFGTAKAQIVVRARLGAPVHHRHYVHHHHYVHHRHYYHH